MPRRLAAALSLLLASAAHAQWLSYDDALAKAQQEHKPILLYLRVNCGPCNREADKFVDAAEMHEAIVRAYAPFVRARIDSMSKAPNALREQRPPAPAVLLLEPGGTWIVAWKKWESLDTYMNFLRLARDTVPDIRSAATLREKDAAEADLVLADVAIQTLMTERGGELYRRAQSGFHRRHLDERERYARIGADFAAYLDHDLSAVADLERTLRSATSAQTKANGYITLGTVYLIAENRSAAIGAFRSALESAAPESSEADYARDYLERLGDRQPAQTAVGAAPTIHINTPPRATITGRAEFSATAAGNVRRVAWFVDDVAVASSNTAPFAEKLDLGSTPRQHTIVAAAFDANGAAVGRAVATVNDRIDFRIAFVSPIASEVSGQTVVEASVETPPDHAVKSVDLLWNDKLIATLNALPYRATFDTPKSFGYFRAVATLDDGRTAEETRVVNSPSVGEVLDVHDIAFAATVVDRGGSRIEGLTASDFSATDSGERVQLKMRDDADNPITIGLAIDASASMRTSLLSTIEAAWKFLDVAISPRDRVFLVAFDDHPHLLQSPTTDRDALKKAVFDLRPSGSTAAIDAIAFSIQQFTGLPGRKALVVITDANERSSTQTSLAAERMAKEIGVPIYLVIPRAGIAEPSLGVKQRPMELFSFNGTRVEREPASLPNLQGLNYHSSLFGNALVCIFEASGGVTLFEPKPQDQPELFERIRDEVRGQYLLSFASRAKQPGAWRELRVSVSRPDAVVRTLAGYYAR